jgi:hypothetical protein
MIFSIKKINNSPTSTYLNHMRKKNNNIKREYIYKEEENNALST